MRLCRVGIIGGAIIGAMFAVLFWTTEAQSVKKPLNTWTGILKANVDPDGFVDYSQIRVNRGGDLYEYLSLQEDANLMKMSEKEKIAFWINAYNAYLVELILAQPAVEKLTADHPLYSEKEKVAHWKLSLNAIKHRVLRSDPAQGGAVPDLSIPTFNPLIHFALWDGTIGGPIIRTTEYTGANLDEELKESARAFINNPKKIWVSDGKLHLSSIFEWYSKDFDVLGGVGAVIQSFLDSKVRPDAPQIVELLASGFPGNAVYEYDWTLNSVNFKNR